MRRATLLLLLPTVLPFTAAAARCDDAPAKPARADAEALAGMMNTVAAWDARGQTAFDDGLRKQLNRQIGMISDPVLREKARRLLPDLERAAVLHARVQQVLADVKEVKGEAKTEPGGPAWLRDAVGDGPMDLFTKLTAIDVCDHSIPVKSGLKNERITDDWLKRLADLPDVRSIDISLTPTHDLKPIGTLKNLETVNLTLTLIKDADLAELRDLTNLHALIVASTQLTGTGMKDLTGQTALQNLNLHYTPVNDDGLEQIAKLTSLQRLEIVHTHFTDKGAAFLGSLTDMRRLQMGSKEATGAAVAPLRAMKELRELDLHDGQATTEGVTYASDIPSLTVLRVYAGPVKDEGMRAIARLPNLETLIIQSAQITDAGLDALAGVKSLKRLEIQGDTVSDEAVAHLKKALPDLTVVK